ncbi:MAG TPA: type II CAAX endopeptidase family protein [Thermoanaerobaculia bacterium]|jgi:membrane protease YdiL (CAAX protease family)
MTFPRIALTLALAFAGAFAVDALCAARGLLPPGFRAPWRRGLAMLVLAALLAVGVFAPLASFGVSLEPDLAKISTPQLFLLHALMVATMVLWFLLGFAGVRPVPPPVPEPVLEPAPEPPPPPRLSLARQFAIQFGFVPRTSVPREIGLGVLVGIGAWAAVLAALMLIAGVLWAVGGESAIPKAPPALVPFIAGLPVGIRFLVSLSAGVVEESFFRGFLQPRVGILLSTAFFAVAHLSYGQPFMLVGIALLSLIYGLLVKWRQNLWPAMAAHALFDGVQLLVVVPAALKMLQGTGGKLAAFLW